MWAGSTLGGNISSQNEPSLIPLSHPLAIHNVCIKFEIDAKNGILGIQADVRTMERTGIEMEAMVVVSVTVLTVYDMCKGTDKAISISEVCLLHKEGGKSGVFNRADSAM